jgi:SagB-type dehydrogenase family enzyme
MITDHKQSIPLAPGPMSLISLQLDEGLGDAGLALSKVLQRRKSSHEFSQRAISLTTLSHLLWAACGVNRPDSNHRTAPSAKNVQEIDIYVAMQSGLYLFDAVASALRLILEEDIRAETGWQDFVPTVPVNLIYVANFNKMDTAPEEEKKFCAALDTGFISQNVYLFCAAEGLATVVRDWVDRPVLAKAMKLEPEQSIIAAQSVGYAL